PGVIAAKPAVPKTAQSAASRADPERPLRARVKGTDVRVRQTIFGFVGNNCAISKTAEALMRSNPDTVVPTLRKRKDFIIWKPAFRAVDGEAPILETIQAASIGSNPKVA